MMTDLVMVDEFETFAILSNHTNTTSTNSTI